LTFGANTEILRKLLFYEEEMTFQFSNSRAPRTTLLYQTVFADWQEYAALKGYSALPALVDNVLDFLRAREPTHSTSALSYRKAAIVAAHRDARALLPDDQRQPFMLENDDKLKMGWKEIMRRKGNRHTPREAVGAEKLKRILVEIPDTPAGTMDKSVLLTGLAYAMRRSEIAALNLDDIKIDGNAMYVTIRRSKTDQIGNGVTLAAMRASSPDACPIAAMERWLAIRGDAAGPLYQHPKFKDKRRICDDYTYLAVKKYGKRAGFDPGALGAHSLRRGCITEIHEAGIDAKSGMALSRHKTSNIYFSYVAEKEAAKNPAVAALARVL
jgi:integrase